MFETFSNRLPVGTGVSSARVDVRHGRMARALGHQRDSRDGNKGLQRPQGLQGRSGTKKHPELPVFPLATVSLKSLRSLESLAGSLCPSWDTGAPAPAC